MDYKKLIIDSGLRMLKSGLTVETWGNISARDPESGLIYLTPSAMDYEKCCLDDVIVCKLDGTIVEGTRKPTIEMGLHLAIYENRPKVNAIVHTHPMYSTVFACIGEDIPQVTDEAAQTLGGPSKVANYALPGSAELAEECIKALGKTASSCLLKSHGAVCVAETMEGAFKVAKVLEVTAEIYYMIKAMGENFKPISEENIAAMYAFAKNCYGQGK